MTVGNVLSSAAEADLRDVIRYTRKQWGDAQTRSYGQAASGYRPPAPETATPPLLPSSSASLHLRTAMALETTMH